MKKKLLKCKQNHILYSKRCHSYKHANEIFSCKTRSGEKEQGRHVSSVQDTEIQNWCTVLEYVCNFGGYSWSEFERTAEDTYEMMGWVLKIPLSPSPEELYPLTLSEGSVRGVLIAVCKHVTGEKTWITRGEDWTVEMECPEILMGSQTTGFCSCPWA